MPLYIASIVFQIQHEVKQTHHQFDESFHLVHADHFDEALTSAEQIGLEHQDVITDIHGHSVNWSFVGVSNIFPIENEARSSEVFSQIRIQENASDFVEYIRELHENLRISNRKDTLIL